MKRNPSAVFLQQIVLLFKKHTVREELADAVRARHHFRAHFAQKKPAS